ncbi:MAG: toxin-antitoxin system YwqK family antitoxin [Bacteroidetes bacterium]|nr:toxin-antitoxin system YwqK family antitoxin [Bacteroidota bacterium]
MKKFILIFLFVTCEIAIAQSFSMSGKDTINFTDAAGKRQGKWRILNSMLHKPGYKDDQVVEEGKYIDSKKTGAWKEYYPNANVKSVITYENNRPNGYAKMYHDNGKIKEEGLWKNNRWVGDYKLYYENGQVQQEFKFNASGKREGAQKYYYENGQVMIEGNWAEGKEAGVVKEYYENGDIRSEKSFNGGNIDVAKTKTYEPKKPIAKKEEMPAVKEAPPVVAAKTEKDNLGKVFNGEGYWKLYNVNKQVSKDGTFSKNRLIDGKVYHYNNDGILTRIAVYKGGKYVGDAVMEEQ